MELRHRYFIAAAEEQNITRAAARLHVSQPPLSRQIRDLEHELGVLLFERTGKSVRLTEAGRVFLIEARAVVDRAAEAVRAIKSVASGLTGELHVGFAPSLAVEILPQALRKFQIEAPAVLIRLHDLSTEEMLQGLRGHTLDLALMVQLPAQNLRGLQSTELRRCSVSAAVSPAHPLAKRRRVSLAALRSERMIGYSRGEYPEFLNWFAHLPWPGNLPPALAEEHDSVTSLIAAVEAGRGLAIAPDTLACLAGPRLRLIPLHPQPPPFSVIAAWRTLNPKIKRFLNAARLEANLPEHSPSSPSRSTATFPAQPG